MKFLRRLFWDERTKLAVALRNGDYFAFYKASDEFKSDPAIVRTAVRLNGYTLGDASSNLRADKEIVRLAVMQVGGAFRYASDSLRADRGFVLEMIARRPDALEFASADLKADRYVVLTATAVWPGCIKFAADHLKADKDFLQRVILNIQENDEGRKYSCELFDCIHKSLLCDRDFMIFAVSNDGAALSYASENLKSDKQVVMAAVSLDGESLGYASEAMQRDRDVALAAIRNRCSARDYVPRDVPWYDEACKLDSRYPR